MRRIYSAARNLAHPYGFICLIAIHTGMRRGEVGGLEWSFITPETFTLPPSLTKNKREHVLPNLIYDELQQIPKVSKYLFPSGEHAVPLRRNPRGLEILQGRILDQPLARRPAKQCSRGDKHVPSLIHTRRGVVDDVRNLDRLHGRDLPLRDRR